MAVPRSDDSPLRAHPLCPRHLRRQARRWRTATATAAALLVLAAVHSPTPAAAQSPQPVLNNTADSTGHTASAEELQAICASLATVIPPMMAAGAAPSHEAITLDHVFTKYYPTGLNLPSHELFADLPPGTLLASDDANGSIRSSGTGWEPPGVMADAGYGFEDTVQTVQGGLPSFCRFGASIITSPISQIYTEVWLPLPDTVPTNTTDPNPTANPAGSSVDGEDSGEGEDGIDGASSQSPAIRMSEPVFFRWLRRSAASAWDSLGFGEQQDFTTARAQLAARRPPPDFTPAPDSGWKGGRMVHIGTGAAKGAIIWPNMKQILARYREVVVADNAGHFSSPTSESWAIANEGARRDSGYRATHLSTAVGQVVTKTFYGVTPGNGPGRRGVGNALHRRARGHGGGGGGGGPPPSSTMSTAAPAASNSSAADDDYSDVEPFMNLTRPYSNRLGFYSYFIGCSMGGRQALSEAALYPADFDGILAGSPAIAFTNTSAWQIWINEKVSSSKADDFIAPSQYDLIRDAVTRACDGLDGVFDGVVSNTTACTLDLFLPSLACPPGTHSKKDADADCLTTAQLENLAGIYSNFTIGEDLVHTGLLPGSEEAWSAPTGLTGKPYGIAPAWFQYQVLNLSSSPQSFDPYTELTADVIALGNALDPGRSNTWYPDLSAFLTHGKLLHTHGLADQLIPPGQSVLYYQAVAEAVTRGDVGALQNAYRLFLVPGMAHCRQGDGPWNFGGAAQTDTGARPLVFDAAHDATLALFQWAENGTAPEYVVGAAYQTQAEQAGYATVRTALTDDRRYSYGVKNTRKLCPWPLQAHLKTNVTNADVAGSFVCQ